MISGPFLIFTIAILLIVCVAAVLVWSAKRWSESQRELQESEAAFIEEAEYEIRNAESRRFSPSTDATGGETPWGAATSPEALNSSVQEPREPGPILPKPLDATPAAMESGSISGAGDTPSGLQKLIANLQQLGVLTSYEGKVELPPPAPAAPIYRLRRGGLALLLDELEGHRFLAHQARRFRVIIVRGADGQPLVVRRYEDFVTDEVSSPDG